MISKGNKTQKRKNSMNLESYLSTTLSNSSTLDEILNSKSSQHRHDESNSMNDTTSSSLSSSSSSSDYSAPSKKFKVTHDDYDENKADEEKNDDDEGDENDDDNDELSDDLKQWLKSTHGTNPRSLLSHMIPSYVEIPNDLDDYNVMKIIHHLLNDDSFAQIQRMRLPNVHTIEHAVDLIKASKNIIVLTGAGCSVSCGIPDFRSRNGIYARLSKDFPDLPDPQSMFDIYYFKHDPRPFFKFAKELYPGQFKPSLSHLFIKKIEDNGKLLRNYTQNIDTLETEAHIKRVVQCHGSFATASCTNCKKRLLADAIKEKIFNQEMPKCDECNDESAIMKPDIVFFGENLPEEYHKSILDDKSVCDLLIVIGSSLKVRPVSNIPNLVSPDVPQILINRESLSQFNFDLELLGDCDVIVNELLLRLGDEWSDICKIEKQLRFVDNEEEIKGAIEMVPCADGEEQTQNITKFLKQSNVVYLKPNIYLFEGAEIKDDTVRYLLSDKKGQDEDSTSE